jgi:hypothetical protein
MCLSHTTILLVLTDISMPDAQGIPEAIIIANVRIITLTMLTFHPRMHLLANPLVHQLGTIGGPWGLGCTGCRLCIFFLGLTQAL